MPLPERKRDLQATSSGAAAVLLPVSVTGNPLFSAVGEAGRHVLAIADACGGGNGADGDNGGGAAGKGGSSSSNSSQSARDK